MNEPERLGSSRRMLSVVVPCFNEHEVILLTHQRMFAALGRQKDLEILYVDDASSDAGHSEPTGRDRRPRGGRPTDAHLRPSGRDYRWSAACVWRRGRDHGRSPARPPPKLSPLTFTSWSRN